MIFAHRISDDTELRLLAPCYAEEQFALIEANRDYLQPWLGWVDEMCSVEDATAYSKTTLDEYAQGESLVVGIWQHGRLAGNVGLDNINTFVGSAEIWYWLGVEFEGRGLVTNACRAIIAHAFEVMELNRVQIRVEHRNARSRAIPQRLGFRHEGTLRQVERLRDTYVDLEVYALLRDEWVGEPFRVHGRLTSRPYGCMRYVVL